MKFDREMAYAILHPHFQGRVYKDEPLGRHCAFGVGGPADIWVSLTSRNELISLVNTCAEQHWPLLIVGSGTNILCADAGVRGIVARVGLDSYTLEAEEHETALLIAESGVRWPRLLREISSQGWGGLEFGVGIPGTLGGAVVSNAGTDTGELGHVLEWIEVLDARGCNQEENVVSIPMLRRYSHDELDLRYRYSRFREQRRTQYDEQGHLIPPSRCLIEPSEIVLQVALRLHRDDPQKLHEMITRQHHWRKTVEPIQAHSAPIFKNPTAVTAAHLIADAGMVGHMHGAAQISSQNANYIVNLGEATARDIATLIEEVHQQVWTHCNVDLELDLDVRGEWNS